jgi:FkbM family methyltransferase
VYWVVGAHYGYYALRAARAAPRGACHAFEPFPGNFWFLEHHLRWNRLGHATAHRFALAGRDGTRGFGGGGSGTGRMDGGGLRVETRSLDSLVREGVCPAPTYLKIDVEGAEAEVLEGARSLREQPNFLCVSTHGREVHRRCLGLLKEFGHAAHDLEQRALIIASGPGRTVDAASLAALAAWT